MSEHTEFVTTRTIAVASFAKVFEPRDPQGHKGTFGSSAIFGGAPGMTGAALLAARSALKSGSGRVYVYLAQDPCEIGVDFAQPELMIRRVQEMLVLPPQIDAWGIGCGLGQSREAMVWLRALLAQQADKPMVLDADALNAMACGDISPDWAHMTTVLTPHPGEASRLLKTSTQHIQSNRLASASALAKKYRAWVVLKGPQTVVTNPQGQCFINPTGHVALASGGTGDVLTGLITSFLAQKHDIQTAVFAGVWLHGAAGQWLAKTQGGPIGATASEVIDAIRRLLNQPQLIQSL